MLQSTVLEKAMAPHSSTLAWKIPGCSPWGCKESDTTEWLHFHFSLSCIGEGNGNPLQCSCLENPRDGGAWWAAVYGVAQSQTQLKRLSSSSSFLWEKKKKRMQNNTSILIHQYYHILLFIFLQFSIMGIFDFNSEKYLNMIIVIFLTKTLNGAHRIHFSLMIKTSFPLRDIVYSSIKRN